MMISRRMFLLGIAGMPLLAHEERAGSLEKRVFDAINFQRMCAGCDALFWDAELGRTARAHSQRMLDAQFFGHNDPDFGDLQTRLNHAGIPWLRCAENVFRERDYPDPVSIAVVEWMYSEGHRRNLLTPEFTTTGVGVATAPNGTYTMTQQFVLRLPHKIPPRMAPIKSGPT